jgi:hypothetical protein
VSVYLIDLHILVLDLPLTNCPDGIVTVKHESKQANDLQSRTAYSTVTPAPPLN